MFTLSQLKDLAIILAGAVALITFLHGVLEYVRQGAQQRSQQFVEMRRRFLENATFRDICDLLIVDDPRLRTIPVQDKRNFGGFLEEIALMVNSGLISLETAHYMFSYYILSCWRSDNFWANIDREEIYWSLFRDFAAEMQRLEESFDFSRKRLRF